MDVIDRQQLTYSKLTSLVDGLIDDHSSHTFASVAGWSYVPTPAEVQFYDELDVKLAMRRGKNQPLPPRTKRPWETPKDKPKVIRADSQSESRRAKLNERLGLVHQEV